MAERRRRLSGRPSGRPSRRTSTVLALVLVLVAGLLVAGTLVWRRLDQSRVEQALDAVPAGSLRVAFTDWDVVRRKLDADLGDDPDRDTVEAMIDQAYDRDYAAASSIDEAAGALQEKFGFGPATAQWEAFAQGRKGATMVLKVADGTDFDVLADNLRTVGFKKPKREDGVWQGGADLIAATDPTISPELQYVALLADQGLVVSSDNLEYAGSAAKVAAGSADSFASVAGVPDLAERMDDPANALVWGKDFACTDLAMSRADDNDQERAEALVEKLGGVTPLSGMAMAMAPNRTLRVVQHFESSEQARKNLRPRAKLAVGEAIGRGVSFADDLELVSAKAVGSDVLLDLRPRTKAGFVLSALYDGPLLFATC